MKGLCCLSLFLCSGSTVILFPFPFPPSSPPLSHFLTPKGERLVSSSPCSTLGIKGAARNGHFISFGSKKEPSISGSQFKAWPRLVVVPRFIKTREKGKEKKRKERRKAGRHGPVDDLWGFMMQHFLFLFFCRVRFPTLFRTHPSATVHNPTRIRIFKRYGWTRISILQAEEEVFSTVGHATSLFLTVIENRRVKARFDDDEEVDSTNFIPILRRNKLFSLYNRYLYISDYCTLLEKAIETRFDKKKLGLNPCLWPWLGWACIGMLIA